MDQWTFKDVLKRLDESGVEYVIHTHAPVTTVADAEMQLPFDLSRVAKTLVFRKRRRGLVLVALREPDRINYRKLANALGIPRADLVRPAADEVGQELGFEVGGIGPIAPNPDVEVVLDSALMGLGIVYCGVGRNDQTLEIDVEDLAYVSSAKVADISE